MKYLNNKTTRHLEAEEMAALLEVARILECAFKKRILHLTVNPDNQNSDDIFGVVIGFDRYVVN